MQNRDPRMKIITFNPYTVNTGMQVIPVKECRSVVVIHYLLVLRKFNNKKLFAYKLLMSWQNIRVLKQHLGHTVLDTQGR